MWEEASGGTYFVFTAGCGRRLVVEEVGGGTCFVFTAGCGRRLVVGHALCSLQDVEGGWWWDMLRVHCRMWEEAGGGTCFVFAAGFAWRLYFLSTFDLAAVILTLKSLFVTILSLY